MTMTYDEAETTIRAIINDKLTTAVGELERELLIVALASKLESTCHRSHSAGINRGIEISREARR